MNITLDLLEVVKHAHSLARILDAATRLIAERLNVDGCFVFLLDDQGDLVRSAGPNLSAKDLSADAEVAAIAAQSSTERRISTTRGETTSLLATPMLVRNTVIGALVLQSAGRREFSTADIGALGTISAQLVGIIENARIIDALDRGELPVPRAASRAKLKEPQHGERVLSGVAASPGIALGTAMFRGAYRLELAARDLPAREASFEEARVRTAIEKTYQDILQIQAAAAREIDEEHALIFASQLLLLDDPELLAQVDRKIAGGLSAPLALDSVLAEFEARLRVVPDAYVQERVDDIDDLRSRLLEHALDDGTRTRFGPGIVLALRIPPSLLIELKTEGAQGLVTASGGATSHGVLLARAMGIPVVTGIDILSVRPGDHLIADGTTGAVVVHPTEATTKRYEEDRQRELHERTEHAKFRDVHARTADGVRVTLYANVGVASDLAVARDNGAEGIGLFRTEFPFIVRDSFPTRADQVRIYSKAYEVFPEEVINFRVLDLGGDKFVAGGHVATERSSFHGYRSIRVLFDHPEVLRDQVQAFALAARNRPLRILIPMVTSIDELLRIKTMIAQALAAIEDPVAQRAPEIGAMIEVPAAVELAADIAKEVDFLSIGTNDLMQYALVLDREDSRMARMSDPYHPATLRMVARVARAARDARKPLGVCGEIAVRPDLALALIALGVDSLSVVPSAIPELKQALARARLEPVRHAMEKVLRLSDGRSVAAALREAQFA